MKRTKQICLLLALFLLFLTSCAPASTGREDFVLPTATPRWTEPTASPEPLTEELPTPTPETEELPQRFRRSSGLAGDGSFIDGAVFVGDSLSYRFIHYLRERGCFGAARCMAICGMSLNKFFDVDRAPLTNGLSAGNASVCSPEFEGMSFADALSELGADAKAIYFMLGTNLSWESTTDAYLEVLRSILELCPSATIYLQTIPFSTNAAYESANEAIRQCWEILEAETPRRVVLLEAGEAFPRAALMPDGIHYSDEACAAWYAYLTEQLQAIEDGLSAPA